MRFWKAILAGLVFLAILLYQAIHIEGFQDQPQMQDILKLINQIQSASGELGPKRSYEDWVGWLYTHPETSAAPLNDFKSRVFNPNCNFRIDWSENLPNKLTRPMSPDKADLANTAYRAFLQNLVKGDSTSFEMLEDARTRFMEPGCSFKRQPSVTAYTNTIPQSLFK
jgi:hypothetical protein